MIVASFAAALALLTLPGLLRGSHARVDPAEFARFSRAALVAGALTLEASLVLLASPTILAAAGLHAVAAACVQMVGGLAAGGPVVGWLATAAATTLPALATWAARRAHCQQRVVRVEMGLGQRDHHDGYDVIVLPGDAPFAVSVPGRPGQILLSRGLAAVLAPDQMSTVLRHEAVHLRHGHDRYLVLARALDHTLGILPFVRRSTSALRSALELWADREAAGDDPEGRALVRSALLRVVHVALGFELAAFGAVSTVLERAAALDAAARPDSGAMHAAIVGLVTAFTFTGIVATGAWVHRLHLLIIMPPYCTA